MFSKKKKNDNQDPEVENNAETQENTSEEQIDTVEETAAELTAEEKLQEENAALNDKYLRLFAEFDNYKRRTQKERVELLQTAGKDVIVSLLSVLDDFDRAMKQLETSEANEVSKEGIKLIYQKLFSKLETKGLKRMTSISELFNPELHDAITEVPVTDENQKGKVVDEIECGYYLYDKIIRHAKVVVGK